MPRTIARSNRINDGMGNDFFGTLTAPQLSPEVHEASDVYGWLCGSWDLEVRRYSGIDVSGTGLRGEVHAARVREGRAVQDVWIMPPRADRGRPLSDPTMNMYGTTLRIWDSSIQAWRIYWRNPVHDHYEDQIGRWSGENVVQVGVRPDGTKTRWTFTEITRESFHWIGEAQPADGGTWKLEGEFLAKRVR